MVTFFFSELGANFTEKKKSSSCASRDRRRIIFFPEVNAGQKRRLYALRHAYRPPIICHAHCLEICPLGRELGCSWFSLIPPIFCLGQPKPRDHGLPSEYVQDKPRSAFTTDCSICGVHNWWLFSTSMVTTLMTLEICSWRFADHTVLPRPLHRRSHTTPSNKVRENLPDHRAGRVLWRRQATTLLAR